MTEQPVPQEKLVDIYKKVFAYYSGLKALAKKYQTEDKGRAAWAAVDLTVRFVHKLNVDPSLKAALIEAQMIIARNIEGGATKKQQDKERDVVDSVALELQLRCKVKLADALKAIVGNDPEAAAHLKQARKDVRSGRKGAEALSMFDEVIKLSRDMPPREAMERALRAAAALRGKMV